VAGAPERPAGAALEDDEVFVSELTWQTYRRGRFKSHRKRDGNRLALVDLETDPQELRDVADQHPDVVAAHSARMDALEARLAAPAARAGTLSNEDADALRQLGYLE
jgi:arylsulfatase A-like enzyme